MPSDVLETDHPNGDWWVITLVLTMTFTTAGNDQ